MRTWLLPIGWEWKKLNDLCKTTSGGTPSRGNLGYFSGDIPWIKSGELNDGLITDSEEHITADAIESSNSKKLLKGTLLIAMYGATVGKLGILYIEAATNQAVCAIFPGELLNRNYLFWFLKSYRKDLIQASFGGAQPNISQTLIRSIEVPIPFPDNKEKSLDIQNRIVQRIENAADELAEARRLHEKIVADTHQLMDAVLAEVLPDPEKRLPERWGAKPLSALVSEEPNQINPSGHPSDTYNYWGLDAISGGQIAEPPPNYIQGSDIKSTRVSFSSKHVLYSKLRPYLNKVIVPSVDGIGSTEWVVYEPNPNILRREYLAFVMRTKWFVNLASGSSYGARMPRANKSVLREIKIPIPLIADPIQSLSIQDQIIERINHFSSDVDSMQKSNAQQEGLLTQLEQSILAQAFRGEL
jgi:type I restriction enzyme S subunit